MCCLIIAKFYLKPVLWIRRHKKPRHFGRAGIATRCGFGSDGSGLVHVVNFELNLKKGKNGFFNIFSTHIYTILNNMK
jgi:hypothetical protein